MAKLNLALLGGFQARLEAGAALVLPTRKAQALLAYLALPPGQAHPRDKLAALLWGGIREESARASLRQALFAIRKALGETAALRQAGDALALEPGEVDTDAGTFEVLVHEGTPGALEQAAALYLGDLLSGFAVDEAPFEEWLLGERERLRELALEGLAKLLAHQRSAGATAAAVQTALKLLTLDPLQEPVHRTLMRLYAELQRRESALRQYQVCAITLQRELGVEPEAETSRLYQEILRQRTRISPAKTYPSARQQPVAPLPRPEVLGRDSPLIGREPEIARLREMLGGTGTGRAQLAAVIGEAGIGKSRLMAELSAEAADRGCAVMLGRSYETEQILPFGPWADALRSARIAEDAELLAKAGAVWRAELSRLLPELGESGRGTTREGGDYLQLFEAFVQLLRQMAMRQPLVLILEDVHWADEMSLRLLAFLGRRLPPSSALIAITAREEELADALVLRHTLEDLAREGHLAEITLGRLSEPNVGALVRRLARAGSEETTMAELEARIWTTSRGNPFMVVETMRALLQGAVPEASPSATALPQRVREVIARRLERLSERGRQLLAVAAVIGRDFDFVLLQRAADFDEVEAAEHMEELIRRRVLHGVGERFDFTHDRIREVAYGQVLQPRRKVLHRRVAEALEAAYPDTLDDHYLALGTHYRHAEIWDKAMGYLRRAGEEALMHAANVEAAQCFEQAVAALRHFPQNRETLEQAFDLSIHLRNSVAPLAHMAQELAYLREAERLATALDDRRRLGLVSQVTALHFWIAGPPMEARAYAQRAVADAEALGDFSLRIGAITSLGLAHHLLGEHRIAEQHFRAIVQSLPGERIRHRYGSYGFPAIVARNYLAWVLAEQGTFAEGRTHGEDGVRLAEEIGHPHALIQSRWALAYLHCLEGRFAAAVRLLEENIALARERILILTLPHHQWPLGYAYAHLGRVDEGVALVRQGVEGHESMGLGGYHTTGVVFLAEAYLLAGRFEEALAQAQRGLSLSRQRGQRGCEAWFLRLLAEVHAAQGPPSFENADEHYRQARSLADELGMRPLVAHCHFGLGTLNQRAGHRVQAQKHLTVATTMYREMDMRFWLDKVEAKS